MNDDELRARLRAADPAASLPAADPAGSASRLEETMNDERTEESRSDGTHDRSRLTWLVAAAAVALIGAGVAFVALDRPDDDPGSSVVAGDSPSEAPEPSVTELTLDAGAVAGRCAPPSADAVAGQDVAVDAVVTSISAGTVTLEPTRFYAGEETDEVLVREVDSDLQALLGAVDFEEGERYLVSATAGEVTLCGLSAAYRPDLADVYDQAF